MKTPITTIEMSAQIGQNPQQLQLDHPLPVYGPKRVRVIVLLEDDNEWDEAEWLKAAARNPAFDFLNDPAEDIYSLSDGKPFHDQLNSKEETVARDHQAQLDEQMRAAAFALLDDYTNDPELTIFTTALEPK